MKTRGSIFIELITAITTGTANINVSHLSKGVYFVEIKNDGGVVRNKFMKM